MKNKHIRGAPPPCARFAVVMNPGTLFQVVDVYAANLRDAEQWASGLREPGVNCDVMRVLPGGQLTTEY